jgi:hypothetical protein
MDADVLALAVFHGSLHAGGNFNLTEGITTKFVARRNVLVGVDEPVETVLTTNFFPNPMVSSAILKIQSAVYYKQTELKVFDLFGRILHPFMELVYDSPLKLDIEFRIDRSGLPAGIYFYQLIDESECIIKGKFLIE